MTVHLVPRSQLYRCDVCGRQLASVEHICTAERGVGTELKAMLSMVGIKQRKGCGCRTVQRYLDRKGISWCEEHIPKIVEMLECQAEKMKVRFSRFVASLAVRIAIKRAKHKEVTNGHSI